MLVTVGDPTAAEQLGRAIRERFPEMPTIVCIGTDRSTGDSVGPLVGTLLNRAGMKVYGTIDQPVHGGNLAERIEGLGGPILAVDASLGTPESVGAIFLHEGPCRPGEGVNKRLPKVGDANLQCCINIAGFMEHFVLQNTRLDTVFRAAEVAANAILSAYMPEAAAARLL